MSKLTRTYQLGISVMILKITQGNMKKTEHLVPLILFLPLLRNASWCIVGDIDLSLQRLHKMKVEHK